MVMWNGFKDANVLMPLRAYVTMSLWLPHGQAWGGFLVWEDWFWHAWCQKVGRCQKFLLQLLRQCKHLLFCPSLCGPFQRELGSCNCPGYHPAISAEDETRRTLGGELVLQVPQRGLDWRQLRLGAKFISNLLGIGNASSEKGNLQHCKSPNLLGFALCLVLGIGFLALASLAYGLFEGDNERVFQFCMMMLTSAVLTFLAVNFYKMIFTKEAHERKMKKQMEETLEATREVQDSGVATGFGKKHAFFVLAFTTGLREGLESIVFLVGVISDVKDLSALPIPIISALILSRLVGCCFFQGTKKVRVDWFMRGSAILLMFIAAGFFSASMHQLQELDVFGIWSPRADRPWQNTQVWDARECCNDKTNRFFVLMRALFGWQDQATPIEIFAWLLYWIVGMLLVPWCCIFFSRCATASIRSFF